MGDAMEIEPSDTQPWRTVPGHDRSSNHSSKEPNRLSILQEALTLLKDGLWPFVEKSVYTALGKEFAEDFLPSRSCTTTVLLDFINQKWIGVFSDTSIGTSKQLVIALYQRVRSGETAMNSLTKEDTRSLLADIERLLTIARASNAASDIAKLIAMLDVKEERTQHKEEEAGLNSPDFMEVEKPEPFWVKNIPVPALSGLTNKLIVLDGPNIAWEHGKSKRFSPRGITEAYLYYVSKGHPTVVFLPRSRLKDNRSGHNERDDEVAINHLRSLEGSAALVLTPEGEYDDIYALYFAKRNGGMIVSNDRYMDMIHQAAADGEERRKEWEAFLRAFRIGFTFHGHDFMPNPHKM